jgi:hypothetical protein
VRWQPPCRPHSLQPHLVKQAVVARNGPVHQRGVGGGEPKKSKALSKPLWIPRKSPYSKSNDDDGDGFSFGRVMGMMMMQNQMDNEQRERQYKSESEQREQEYQLHQEEMAIAREEAWAQRQMMSTQTQMMNAMFMAMLLVGARLLSCVTTS